MQRIYEDAKSFDGHGSRGDVDHLYERLTFLLDTGYEHIKTRKFVDNLLKRKKEWLFRFVIDPEVEPTNNRAERALRPSALTSPFCNTTHLRLPCCLLAFSEIQQERNVVSILLLRSKMRLISNRDHGRFSKFVVIRQGEVRFHGTQQAAIRR